MTILAGIVDVEPRRKSAFVERVQSRLSSYQELIKQRWDEGPLTLLTASAKTTPVHHVQSPGNWLWIMGDLYDDAQGDPAGFLQGLIEKSGPLAVHGQSGYYLACSVGADGKLTLGTDILGLFPLYFWSTSEVLVFSTLPGLIHLHRAYNKQVSAEGLAGILLQSHLANCQTLWEGIRRSDPGNAVQWRIGAPAASLPANRLVPSEEYFGLKFGPARKLFDATLHRAVIRATRRGPGGLMLSGGMDSRLVAGHLHEARLQATTAFTFGDPGDHEVRCAQAVAKTLHMQTRLLPARFERYHELALVVAEEEHLSNTFHDFSWLTRTDSIKCQTLELVNGFLGDHVMGGSLIPHAYNHRRGLHDFDALYATVNSMGFAPAEIISLVRALPMTEAVAACVAKMRATYETLPGLPFQKAALWGLYHRCRYHVGPYIWRLSKFVWPVMPYADRPMLETCLAMPSAYLNNRQIQVDTLKHDHRRLAVLPLDRNSHDTSPLLETRLGRARRQLCRWAEKNWSRQREKRTYYRLFDINNPGWRAIRQEAALRSDSARQLFNQTALDHYLQTPDQDIICADGIIHSARLKTLVGLSILSDRLTG